jgi:dihydropteroate synthase
MKAVHIVGVINATPDSVSNSSDKAAFAKRFGAASTAFHDYLFEEASRHIREGADIIEVGGDSTRPGSSCVGWKEEWKRIDGILTRLEDARHMFPPFRISVDTHHIEIIEKLASSHIDFINLVSDSFLEEVISILKKKRSDILFTKLVVMQNLRGGPHNFLDRPSGDIILQTNDFFSRISNIAKKLNWNPDDLILDPGWGQFLDAEPEITWELIERVHELNSQGLALMVAVSRKGFLITYGASSGLIHRFATAEGLGDRLPEFLKEEFSPIDRDPVSAYVAMDLLRRLEMKEVYLRVHNVALHKSFLHTYYHLS